ncbi:alkene reductase [Streptomyces sp. NPDC050504]|uniref:oxidoreductase n=1 Tax=Streptomyces sp. NPDC050504 TaxID=3365618 RepID=UPI003798FA89
MAPMTRNRAAADGVPLPMMATYYAQRATAGLIVAEASTPNAVGQTYPNITAIHTDAHVEGWRKVTDAVRDAGGRMFLQLQHGGRVGHPDNSGHVPVAPSPVPLPEPIHTPGGLQEPVVPRELTVEEIRATVADFAAAARRAVDAGFAGVEVHAANGYLLHQFLGQGSNRRTDEYGGPVAHRVRFVVEVVEAVAAEIGAERVGVRVSPGNTVNGMAEGDTEEIYRALVAELAEIGTAPGVGRGAGQVAEPVAGPGAVAGGLAYLHLVWADPDEPLFHTIRAAWPGTLIANPRLPWDAFPEDGGRPEAERLLAEGADLVSLGRAFLANPDLVARLRQDAPLNPLQGKGLMYVGGEAGYTDYPTLPAPTPVPAPAPVLAPAPAPRAA